MVLALSGAGVYSFDRLLLANGIVVAALAAVFHRRLLFDMRPPGPTGQTLVVVAIVMAGLWLYFPPAEYVIGGRDPGTYVNEGIQIAQRGQIAIRDPVIASVPEAFRDLFFPSHQQPFYYGLRFMGFFIQDPGEGRVIGQFPHLLPASIALGYGLNGLSGARQVSGAWAILGLVAVYLVARQLSGRLAASLAVGLLAINVIEVWFARYPNTELVMQALLFASLLAFGRALDGSPGFFGTTSAALLSLMLFLRYDVVLAFISISAAAVLAPVTRQKVGWSFGVVLAAGSAIGFWYLKVPMRAYSYYPLGFTGDQIGWWLIGASIAVAMLANRMLRREPIGAFVRRLMPPAVAFVLVALAIYAWRFRQPGGGLADADAYALRTFSWYTGGWVLGISLAGMAWAAARRFWRHPAFFLTFAAFSLFFFYKMRIVPEHFWSARRFLAVTLPCALIFLTTIVRHIAGPCALERIFGNAEGGNGRWAKWAGCLCTVGLLLPVAWHFWTAGTPVRHHVEYAGLIPHLETLAGRVHERDLLLVESRNASDLHALAVPMAYIYARNVLVLNTPTPPKRTFEAFLGWAGAKYERVLFLGGGGSDLLTRTIHANALGGDRFQVPEYDAPLDAYPHGVRRKEFEYGLYELVTGAVERHGGLDLSIGALDDLNVVRFHAREERDTPPAHYRWTTGQSFVVLTDVPETPHHIVIWMSSGGRPRQAPVPDVEVTVEDQLLGTAVPTDALTPFTFDIPAGLAVRMATADEPLRLRLRVPTWNPRDVLGVADSRDLGVIVSRVQVQ